MDNLEDKYCNINEERTIHNKAIEDILNYDIFASEEYSFPSLTKEDKDLIEKYAPFLFNTLPSNTDLNQILVGFIQIVDTYRFAQSQKKFKEEQLNVQNLSYKNSSQRDKEKALIKYVDKIIGLLGSEYHYITEYDSNKIIKYLSPSDEAIKILHDMKLNPHNYFKEEDETYIDECNIPHDYKADNKKIVKQHLVAIKLNGKTKVINDFIALL